jgi:hypothetical protein
MGEVQYGGRQEIPGIFLYMYYFLTCFYLPEKLPPGLALVFSPPFSSSQMELINRLISELCVNSIPRSVYP